MSKITPQSTYFIQMGKDGPIKIGKSQRPGLRLSAIQTGTPVRVELLAQIDGNIEKELHNIFSNFRQKGEWFDPHPSLTDFIKRIIPFEHPLALYFSNNYFSYMYDSWNEIHGFSNSDLNQSKQIFNKIDPEYGWELFLGEFKKQIAITKYLTRCRPVPNFYNFCLNSARFY
jgi:Meiotically up-regulated gene 113